MYIYIYIYIYIHMLYIRCRYKDEVNGIENKPVFIIRCHK